MKWKLYPERITQQKQGCFTDTRNDRKDSLKKLCNITNPEQKALKEENEI